MRNKSKSAVKVLAIVTVVISLFAAIEGSPYRISIQPANNNEEFKIAGKTLKVMDVNNLAEWIMDRRNDFLLIDLRPVKKFHNYHLPFAINVPNAKTQNEFESTSASIVIYGDNKRYSVSNLESLVKDRSEQVYILKGGMAEWINKILFPDLRENKLSKKETDKIYKTSTFFGGKPYMDNKRSKRKYKREGC